MMHFGRVFVKQFKRELIIYSRQMRLMLNSGLFFLMFIIFFPLTLPPDTQIMRLILPGLVWMALLLSLLLSAERLFTQDYDQGIIEQWLVSKYPLFLYVCTKLLAYWLFNIIPIIILCPLIAMLFSLNVFETLILMISLLLGSPTLVLLSALAAVFGVGIHQKSALMALIVLPLTLPILIFAGGTLSAALNHLPINGYLAILTAISLISIAFLPFAISGLIKITLNE